MRFNEKTNVVPNAAEFTFDFRNFRLAIKKNIFDIPITNSAGRYEL